MNCDRHDMLYFVLVVLLSCCFKGGLSAISGYRLVDGTNPQEGRVEVLYEGVWGSVCDDWFDNKAAMVVCRSLGFPSATATAWRSAYFGQSTGPITLDDVICIGTEASIDDCIHSAYLTHNCAHSEDVGVDCDVLDPPLYVRLVGGATANEGRVEIIYRNYLGTVCDDNWGDNDAEVVCSMLGYPRSGSQGMQVGLFYPVPSGIMVDEVNCVGSEDSLAECPTTIGWAAHDCSHYEDAGVRCAIDSCLDNFLIFTDTYYRTLSRMDLTTHSYAQIPHPTHDNPIAVGYDDVDCKLYWTDVGSKQIKQSDLNGANSVVFLTLSATAIPDGLTVDPISRNLFFTDTGTNTITVARLDGSASTTLNLPGLDEPRGIAVHPGRGLIFWTDWGTNPKIERANMDGSSRTTIVDTGLGWPNGIVIDYAADHLYWTDAQTDKIERANFDGSDRVTIYVENGHLFGLALVGDYIYYTDWAERSVIMLKKTGTGRTAAGPPAFGRLNDIIAYKSGEGIYALPGNICSASPGVCSNICVPMPGNAYVCL